MKESLSYNFKQSKAVRIKHDKVAETHYKVNDMFKNTAQRSPLSPSPSSPCMHAFSKYQMTWLESDENLRASQRQTSGQDGTTQHAIRKPVPIPSTPLPSTRWPETPSKTQTHTPLFTERPDRARPDLTVLGFNQLHEIWVNWRESGRKDEAVQKANENKFGQIQTSS